MGLAAESAAVAPCVDAAPEPALEKTFRLFPESREAGSASAAGEPGAALSGKTPKRFWTASAEVMGLNVVTWLFDKYFLKARFANISIDRWKENLRSGWVWDHDDYPTNEAEHPFHGSFYYAAPRSNGYNLWQSAIFTAAGSVLWEYFGEDEKQSINDLINTTLGGVTQGEVFHRLSTMLWDNTASGGARLWREIGGFLVNPMGGFNRLVHGEWTKDFPNPEGRLPERFSVEIEGGYQHSSYGSPDVLTHPGQSHIGIFVRYGDAFVGDNREPFDVFEARIEFAPPSDQYVIATRWNEHGQLAAWSLPRTGSADHRLAISMNYDYANNMAQVFSSQNFSGNWLARVPVGRAEVRSDLAAIFMPLAALQSDYPKENRAAVRRPYDYGIGGGARWTGRLYQEGRDVLLVSYEADWVSTLNGLSIHTAQQALHAEGRLPVTPALAVGGGYTWSKRVTSYAGHPTVEVEGPEWRVFASLLLR